MTTLWKRLSSKEFQQVFKEGSFRSGKYLCIIVKKEAGPGVGFTIKKKKRNAVERNFLRRRIKEAFLKIQEFIPREWQIVVIGLPDLISVPIDVLSSEIYRLIKIEMNIIEPTI